MYHRKSSKKSTDKFSTIRLQAQKLIVAVFPCLQAGLRFKFEKSSFHEIFDAIFDFSSNVIPSQITRKIENDLKNSVEVRLFQISSANYLGGTKTRQILSLQSHCNGLVSRFFRRFSVIHMTLIFFEMMIFCNFENACPRNWSCHFR